MLQMLQKLIGLRSLPLFASAVMRLVGCIATPFRGQISIIDDPSIPLTFQVRLCFI